MNPDVNSMPSDEKPILDEPPPALGTWPRVYTAVLIYLAAVIVIFFLLTRRLAP
jgi:hypothetical protein